MISGRNIVHTFINLKNIHFYTVSYTDFIFDISLINENLFKVSNVEFTIPRYQISYTSVS